MGITERRGREKERRRNDIINAAEEVFFSNGFESSTMDDVAAKAELSKGTLYLYFKSKQELYHAIIFRGMQTLNRLFEEALKEGGDGIGKTLAIGKAFIRFNREYPDYHDAVLYYGHTDIDLEYERESGSDTTPLKKGIMDLFIGAIREGTADGTIRKDIEPKKTALMLWGELTGILMLDRYKGRLIREVFGVDTADVLAYFIETTKKMLEP